MRFRAARASLASSCSPPAGAGGAVASRSASRGGRRRRRSPRVSGDARAQARNRRGFTQLLHRSHDHRPARLASHAHHGDGRGRRVRRLGHASGLARRSPTVPGSGRDPGGGEEDPRRRGVCRRRRRELVLWTSGHRSAADPSVAPPRAQRGTRAVPRPRARARAASGNGRSRARRYVRSAPPARRAGRSPGSRPGRAPPSRSASGP